MMQVGWRPECRWLGYLVADSIDVSEGTSGRSLLIVVVRGDCPVRVSIDDAHNAAEGFCVEGSYVV